MPCYDLPCNAGRTPGTSRQEILETLVELVNRGLVAVDDGGNVDRDELMREPPENFDTRCWFGLAAAGAASWEVRAADFGETPVDWSHAWTAQVSFEDQKGFVDAPSSAACLAAIDESPLIQEGWEIDRQTLQHSELEWFRAKYYKRIAGGHRVSFRIRKRPERAGE